MRAYLDLLQRTLDEGLVKPDRTGTGTRSVFGHPMRFDLAAGFPLLTTKKLHWRSIAAELVWFVRGGTNVGWLQERGVRIWNEWADEDGELGPIYGAQWRAWQGGGCEPGGGETIDQLAGVIESIRDDPHSRRHLVSAWNVSALPQMALPPCHLLFQFWVGDGTLSCLMFQRSADVFLGVPFNIASYALLTHLMARLCDLAPGELVIVLGDAHLYANHAEQAREQLSRSPRELPRLRLDPSIRTLDDLTADDFDLDRLAIEGYEPHPHIAAPIAV